jgi:hypothetical protein
MDSYIYIEYALWGRDNEYTCNETIFSVMNTCNSGSNAIDTMIEKCDGQNSCMVSASINEFGNPCENRTGLYLAFEYSCRQKFYDVLACQDSGQLPLTCPKNQVISTSRGFFGRDNMNTTCPTTTQVATDNCTAEYAGRVFQYLCDGKRDCEIEASTRLFGDPCPDSRKYFSGVYTCEECANIEDDLICEMYAMDGECAKNPEYMFDNCRKACTKCEFEPPMCENRWFNDTQCNIWAEKGECDSNPAWMFLYCKGSCIGCNKKTDCINKYTFNNSCTSWESQGQCLSNTNWMFPNCTNDCFHCNLDNANIVECKNRYDDHYCAFWAGYGHCESNAGFMMTNCLKTCLQCEEDPVCENKYGDDQACQDWANKGECAYNLLWMHKNCWKACMACEGQRKCENKQKDDATCEHWAKTGLIATQPQYMTRECWKTTSGCAGNPKVQDCLNSGDADADCDFWSFTYECGASPDYMYSNCYKGCTQCDEEEYALKYVGNPPEPGLPDKVTAYRSIVLPGQIPQFAMLSHFFAYFNSVNPVFFQIWRWVNGTLVLQYSQKFTPDVAMTVQAVKAEICFYVYAGDKFGFADFGGTPTIGATDFEDNIYATHYFKEATNTVPMSTFNIGKKFSAGLAYAPGKTC